MASVAKDFLDIIKDIRGTNFNDDGTPKEGFWFDVKTWHASTLNNVNYSAEWASKAENSLVSNDAGGNGAKYSALHYASKASASAASASANAATISSAVAGATASKVAAEASANAALTYSGTANTAATTAVNASNTTAAAVGFAWEWANKAEDSLVNDGTNPAAYSAYHWAQKAEAIVGGTTSFTDLSDVPASYVGHANKYLRVNVSASAVEFDTLDKTDVGLSNVDNTTDLNKPVSTATQTALNNLLIAATTNSTALAIALG